MIFICISLYFNIIYYGLGTTFLAHAKIGQLCNFIGSFARPKSHIEIRECDWLNLDASWPNIKTRWRINIFFSQIAWIYEYEMYVNYVLTKNILVKNTSIPFKTHHYAKESYTRNILHHQVYKANRMSFNSYINWHSLKRNNLAEINFHWLTHPQVFARLIFTIQ